MTTQESNPICGICRYSRTLTACVKVGQMRFCCSTNALLSTNKCAFIMEALKINKAKSYNPKTKQYGYTVRVNANGKISAEKISEEACENTTLHPEEALLANKLFIKKIAKYLREGYIVELGEIGTLQPGCTSKWAATKEELTKDLVKPRVNYNPSDEVEAAIKGAKLNWIKDEDEEESDDQSGNGGNTGGSNDTNDGMLG